MRHVAYWWILFWLQVVGFGVAYFLGTFHKIWIADVSKISFVVLIFHTFSTGWFGCKIYEKHRGYVIDDEETAPYLCNTAMMLGMIGTLVGFIYTLQLTLGSNLSVDAVQLRATVSELAKGIGTAGWTTLLGMGSALLLQTQSYLLSRVE